MRPFGDHTRAHNRAKGSAVKIKKFLSFVLVLENGTPIVEKHHILFIYFVFFLFYCTDAEYQILFKDYITGPLQPSIWK